MNSIDLNKSLKNEHVPSGTILIIQGNSENAINIIHSGMAELLSNRKIEVGATIEQIIEGSRRVGFVKGESIYGALDLQNNEPFDKSIRALTDCIITVIPINDEGIFQKLKENFLLSLKILRALVQRIDSCIFLMSSYKSLWHNLNNIAVSIALAAKFPGIDTEKKHKGTRASLVDYSAYLKNRLGELKLSAPEIWDPNVFLGKIFSQIDNSDLPNKIDNIHTEALIDNKQFLFFKRLLRAKDDDLIAILQKDEPIAFYIYQFLSEALEPLVNKNEELANIIFDLIETLFANDGWIAQILNTQESKEKKATIFNHYMSKFCWQFRKEIIQLMGLDLKMKYPVYSNLQNFNMLDLTVLEPEKKASDSVIRIKEGNLTKYNNLLNRILEFSYMGDEFCREFTANLNKFKETPNKFENNPVANKLRKTIAQQYWQLYEKCFLSVIASDLKSFMPGIMLHFGVVDETLLTKEQLLCIDNAYAKSLYVDTTIPVMTLPYFLEKIYKNETRPSVSELGQSFQDVLRKQANDRSKTEMIQYSDTAEDRARYEIKNIIASVYKMVYGSVATAFPILCSDILVGGQLEQFFIEPETLAKTINSYKQRDFSMFYRDVVIHLKQGSEIIQKEVIPDIVLYPIYGSKMLMWQELDGVKRDSKGRALLPLFFSGDKDKYLLNVIGNFRWELQRTIAGANWMDPVEGGLSGAYYDYINFYKKNPNLTPENKERLKEFIKKTRSDKDRFTSDYIMWINYEFDGIPKLTNVAREIFYRFCPFPKKERDRLGLRPAFMNLEMKYQSIMKRSILKIDTRIRKFEKAGEKYSQELADYLNFLQL